MTDPDKLKSEELTVQTRTSKIDDGPYQSIRRRLLTLILGLILITVMVITIVAALSTRNVSQRAQEISSQSLRKQAEEYMAQITSSSARENELILDRANRDVQAVADAAAVIYSSLDAPSDFEYSSYWSFDENMFQIEGGQYMNGKEDLTTVLVPNFQKINEDVKQDVELGAYLESTMAGIFENNPNVEAIYFATPNEVTRYYPNIGLGELVPPDFQVTGRVWYSQSEEANRGVSEPSSVWTKPYQDATGLGLVTTVAMPAYDSKNNMLGVVGMDITLDEVSANIKATQILESGYSFLIDADGKALILPDQGYIDMLGRMRESEEFGTDLKRNTAGFAAIIEQMVEGESGFASVQVGGDELFVAYSPIASTGWSLGSVVMADEVLKSVNRLEQDLQATNLSLLINRILPIILCISIVLIILSLLWTNRLVKPIQELAEAAQLIGIGHWDINIPVRGNDEIALLAQTMNSMTEQLNITFGELEQRVAERTGQLEQRSLQLQTASEVARDITILNDLDDLLDQSVTLIQERFNFYFVSLFLTDESGKYAHLTTASGEAKDEMLERGVRLLVGQEGIVGHVISYGKPRVASDVKADSAYLEYPLLPDTHSEVALPLRVGTNVIGALDVQSTLPDAFEREVVTVLQTLADQLAIAIENIRLVERLQSTLQESQVFYNEQIQNSWQTEADHGAMAYEFDQVRVKPLLEYESNDVAVDKSRLVIPVKLRDQVIGYIGLEDDNPHHKWTKDDIAIVEATANQAALTMENARLLAETQRHAEREQMMGHIAARVRETLDLDLVLQTTVREISRTMNIEEAEIRLGSGTPSGNGKE